MESKEPVVDVIATAVEELDYAQSHINTLMLAAESPLFSRQDAYKVLNEAGTLIMRAKADLQRQIDALD